MTAKKIRRLFIANRGEIARRIATGARALGIESVAITDRAVPPAYLAGLVQHFVRVPEESTALYLDPDLMVRLAVEAGADALHPGFGFLSENAAFAAKVEAAGLTWIGPPPSAIDAMASKAKARDLAEASGVPCVPGLQGIDLVDGGEAALRQVKAFAASTGYPLLIKAALGGGGKGMRLVHHEKDLAEAAKRASSEAMSSFGDPSVIIEKYLGSPRHVEVQILADGHGEVLAIGDRDCSVQRRHQKIIEEAPAPGLSPSTRRAMHEAARNLARSVGYVSAGTVEFLVDWSDAARRREDPGFYFLEMNTRLQVEHPVTEEVFGIDLVAWQLKIAQGEALPPDLAQQPSGHAFETRIYAEDAAHQFLPAPGPIHAFLPFEGAGIRWEIGLDGIDEVTTRFDPMIAKLVVKGETREAALDLVKTALEGTVFVGPTANFELLAAIAADPVFRAEPVSTHYIQDRLEALTTRIATGRASVRGPGEALLEQWATGRLGSGLVGPLPGAPSPAALTARAFAARPTSGADHASVPVAFVAEQHLASPNRPGRQALVARALTQTAQGGWRGVNLVKAQTPEGTIFDVALDGRHFQCLVAREGASGHHRAGGHGEDIVSPVPGKVVKLLVKPGDDVAEHQTVVILESMKMEFEVQAPKAGIIGEINVTEGQQVNADDILATWQREHPA